MTKVYEEIEFVYDRRLALADQVWAWIRRFQDLSRNRQIVKVIVVLEHEVPQS